MANRYDDYDRRYGGSTFDRDYRTAQRDMTNEYGESAYTTGRFSEGYAGERMRRRNLHPNTYDQPPGREYDRDFGYGSQYRRSYMESQDVTPYDYNRNQYNRNQYSQYGSDYGTGEDYGRRQGYSQNYDMGTGGRYGRTAQQGYGRESGSRYGRRRDYGEGEVRQEWRPGQDYRAEYGEYQDQTDYGIGRRSGREYDYGYDRDFTDTGGYEQNEGWGRNYGASRMRTTDAWGSTAGSSWWEEGPYTGRGPQGYTRSNERIIEDVNERLTQHGYLDASGLRVSAENGIVTLEGEVKDRRTKRMAEDTAASVTGVNDVQNRLSLRDREERGNDRQKEVKSGQKSSRKKTSNNGE